MTKDFYGSRSVPSFSNLVLEALNQEFVCDVIEIERKINQFPWSDNSLLEFNGRLDCNKVLLLNNRVIGYFYSQKILDETTLLNIGISDKYQGLGYGKYLLKTFLEQIPGDGVVWLEVRKSNIRAYNLYLSFGFEVIDIRKNYYTANNGKFEDAIIMKLNLETGKKK